MMQDPQVLLATADIFKADDGVEYAFIELSKTDPRDDTIKQLYDLIEYVVEIPRKITVILDLRQASPMPYMPFFPSLLKQMDEKTDNKITEVLVWIPQKYSFMQAVLKPMMDTYLKSTKMSIVTM